MPRKRLKCFAIMSRSQFYRPHNRILTVHAASQDHAKRLVKELMKAGKLPKYLKFSVKQIYRCFPESGEPCYYKMIAQPSYGKTPRREILPNSPEWNKKFGPRRQMVQKDGKTQIPLYRQKKIEFVQKKRPDFYE